MRNLSFKCTTDFQNEDSLHIQNQIKEIFFLSSSVKNFTSEEAKEAFFMKWCGDYLLYYPEQFFISFESETKKVFGYICGVKDTSKAMEHLKVPGLSVFTDLYEQYPAHLHINFHPDSRGMGLGSKLVNDFINYLKSEHVKGLHLITSRDSDNTRFYDRLGFTDCHERKLNSYDLYFMGKSF